MGFDRQEREKDLMATSKGNDDRFIDIVEIHRSRMTLAILGETPFISHRMAGPDKLALLQPPQKKTVAEKAMHMKHDMTREFQESYYRLPPGGETLIGHKAVAFKRGIAATAIDMPGASKAQIGRLCRVEGELIPIYGIPQLFTTEVRNSDMNHTPDLRTRAIMPRWACWVTVSFIQPQLNEDALAKLIGAMGELNGYGDWRQQKGSGSYGAFKVVQPDDETFLEIVRHGGREAQERAVADPACYDEETQEMYSWWLVEVGRRELRSPRQNGEVKELVGVS